MKQRVGRISLSTRHIARRFKHAYALNPLWQFVGNIVGLIWEYRWYSLAIFAVTIFQEIAAAFINAVACLDAIVSYSRAYHIYATAYNTVTSADAKT